jgi:hypothetical protein
VRIVLICGAGRTWWGCRTTKPMKSNQTYLTFETIVLALLVATPVSIVTLAALFVFGSPVGVMPSYSSGSRVGVVTKLSNKGVIWKSWEAEMNLGGFRNSLNANGSSSVVANTFEFNVENRVLADRIGEAMRNGDRVEVIYREWGIRPLSIGSRYVVTDVKAAK